MEDAGPTLEPVEAEWPARHAFLAPLRHEVRRRLEPVVDPDHLLAVEMVTSELVSHAIDAGASSQVVVRVQPLRVLTSIRVRCPAPCDMGREIFALRERVLQRLTVAFGTRLGDDGSVELWAEVWRPDTTAPPASPSTDPPAT